MALSASELIADPPDLHGFAPSGEAHSWGLTGEALQIIDDLVRPDWQTLETGAGVSTVLFAINSTDHTTIVPDQDQIDRIRQFCADQEISTERLQFVLALSESALPSLEEPELDLVLLDGSHSFPSVFIDWFYTAGRLRTGGWLVLDDINLWTGAVLRDFLQSESDWRQAFEVPMRTAFFRKVRPIHGVRNWIDQPYVVKRSLLTPRRRALAMLRKGQFGALGQKARKRIRRRRDR